MNEENKNEIVEETSEVEVVETEEVDKGIDAKLQVTFESFKEYYNNNNNLKQQLKSAAIYSALLCIILYIFRGDKAANVVLTQMVVAIGTIFVLQFSMYFLTKYIFIPQQFKKNDINQYGINMHIDNQGIKQNYNGHEHKLLWGQVVLMKETNNSFLIYANKQSGLVLSKTMFDEEGISYVRGVASARVYQYIDERK